MLTLVRIVLGLVGLLAVWCLSYWIFFAQFDHAGSPFLGRGAPFLVGLLAAGLVLAATEHLQHGWLSAIVLGALLLGAIGAFFGPVIAGAMASGGPLLEFIMSGPGGLLLGMPAGAAWWGLQRLRKSAL